MAIPGWVHEGRGKELFEEKSKGNVISWVHLHNQMVVWPQSFTCSHEPLNFFLMDLTVFQLMSLCLTPTLCSHRLTTCDILRVCLLVLHLLLWAEPTCRGDLPRLAALPHSRWIHRPIQLWTLLSRPAVQRQPQLCSGAHTQTHRYLFYFTGSIQALIFYSWAWHNQQVAEPQSSLFPLQDGAWGCTTLAERCLQSVSVTVPSLSRVPTATSAMAGILLLSAKYLQVNMRGYTPTHNTPLTITIIYPQCY